MGRCCTPHTLDHSDTFALPQLMPLIGHAISFRLSTQLFDVTTGDFIDTAMFTY